MKFFSPIWLLTVVVFQLTAQPFVKEDKKQSKEINLTNHPSADRHPSWHPDGNKIIFESDRSGTWGIYSITKDEKNVECLVCDKFNNRVPSFRPNSDIILFESDRSGFFELYEFDLQEKTISKVINSANFSGVQLWGAYSPNGKYLAFCSFEGDKNENLNIYIKNAQTNIITNITSDTVRSLYPAWSSDSKKIIFFSRRDTNGLDDELYLYNIKNKVTTRLTIDPLHDFCPAWVNKHNVVYAKSMENTRPELFLLDLNKLKSKRMTFNEDGDSEPSVSKDGKWLAWTAFRSGNFEIVMSLLPDLYINN